MNTKLCNTCGLIKPVEDFYKSRSNKQGRTTACKECYKVRVKKYTNRNKVKVKEYQKKYSNKNRQYLSKYQREYQRNNREKINKQKQNRLNSNPVIKLSKRISNLIYMCLKRKGYTKRSKSMDILGIDYKGLINYLNNNPYNFRYEEGLYDIDHIVPIVSATTEDEVLELNHYTNLQLLPKKYNQEIKKNSPWNKEHFENWLKNNVLN